ncbi:hypothetical protein QR680_006352 [Steinernema hermaphroditum]|uniref:TIL domain-containing protein n=1 Tax=Steinernema hermaphroditum TaxID=289476 RepID=A0AA39LX92_9BILA|nr:hypothetical protein QR680_006352 [Steinernema hermaphroditum]
MWNRGIMKFVVVVWLAITTLCDTVADAQSTTTTKLLSISTSSPISGGITCGPNEEVTKCLPCEQDCDTAVRNITTICVGQVCFDDGPEFCECPIEKGFARNCDDKCVAVSECPIPGCLTGEEWSDSPCDGTCEVPQPNCSLFDCLLPDCACKPGYVRFYSQCIPQSTCPPKKEDHCGGCPAGQLCKHHPGWWSWFFGFFPGGHSCECGTNLTTSSPLTTTPKATFNSSVSASTNLTCGQNEEVSNCLPCEQSCDSAVRNITTICINDLCFNDGPQFCDCSVAKGFARDFNGKCIPHSQCPIPGCPSGQEWSKGPCDGTCEVPQPNCTLFNCSFPGCACKPGYVRFYGQCIPQAMCPPRREDRCGGCPAGKTCSHHEGYFFHRDRKPQCQWYNPCGFEVEEIDTYGPDK